METAKRIKHLQKVKQKPKYIFYNSIKYLAILCQIFGQFPVKNLFKSRTNLLKHSWFCGASVYSLIYLIFVWVFQKFILQLNFSSQTFEFWCNARNYLTSIVCLFSWSEIVKLINKIDCYHYDFDNLPVKIVSPRSKCRNIGWAVVTFLSLCALYFITVFTMHIFHTFSSSSSEDRTFITFKYSSEILIFTPRHLQNCLYILFCHELTVCFKQLHISWKRYLSLCPNMLSANCKYELEKYWILHLDLLECMRLLSGGFGLRIAAIFFTSGADIVSHLLQYYIERDEIYLSNLFLDLYLVVITYAVAAISDNVNTEVSSQKLLI